MTLPNRIAIVATMPPNSVAPLPSGRAYAGLDDRIDDDLNNGTIDVWRKISLDGMIGLAQDYWGTIGACRRGQRQRVPQTGTRSIHCFAVGSNQCFCRLCRSSIRAR